jgi:DNA-binding response OmpR family regulator
MPKTILIVDDEPRLLSLMEAYLQKEGFRVAKAQDGRQALAVAREREPDLIVLDIMMPEMDGYEFMRRHRKDHDTPIIVLTAKVEDDEKVVGLEMGADDYITKPFQPRELVARVRAVLRRVERSGSHAAVLQHGDLTLDRLEHRVDVGGQRVHLTPSEFGILASLMSAPGRVFSRMELLESLQGEAFEGYERSVDVHIKNLRAKIEANPRSPHYIETVYGVGYRLSKE